MNTHVTHLNPWTTARVAQLVELWPTGLSCSQIALQLGGGLSRCAVIGKIHRMKLGGRAKPAPVGKYKDTRPTAAYRTPKAPVAAKVDGRTRGNGGVKNIAPKSAPLPKFQPMIVTGPGVSILDLDRFHCRAVVSGDGFEALYCGAQAQGSYCKAHAERFLIKPVNTRSDLARSLRKFA